LADALKSVGDLKLADMTDKGMKIRHTAGEAYESREFADDWGDGDNVAVSLPSPHGDNVKRIRIA
jgi:hypothetical protein